MFQAIDTEYRGYRFRSRTESRWAVYFDALGITWEYEKEGFAFDVGGEVIRYLPDFWLPQVGMWAEVKGEPFKFHEIHKCCLLARHTNKPCILLDGLPEARPYRYFQWVGEENGGWAEDYYCAVSMYKDYPLKQRRFFVDLGADWPAHDFSRDGMFADVHDGIRAARSARFEFGEHGASSAQS